ASARAPPPRPLPAARAARRLPHGPYRVPGIIARMAALPVVSRPTVPEAVGALRRVEENVARVIRGKEQAIRLALATVIARGHLLIEDIPGVGKTTLARALPRPLPCRFRRVPFTSHLL